MALNRTLDRDAGLWGLSKNDVQTRRELFFALEVDDYWAVSLPTCLGIALS
jgi:hypothetical protein